MNRQVDGSIIGELLLGELPNWRVGICTVQVSQRDPETIRVYGECGFEEVDCNVYRESVLVEGEMTKDLSLIASRVNEAIQREYDAL